MARPFATRIGEIRANRFAEKQPCVHNTPIASNLQFAVFSALKRGLQKKKRGSVRGTPKRLCDSGHLSLTRYWDALKLTHCPIKHSHCRKHPFMNKQARQQASFRAPQPQAATWGDTHDHLPSALGVKSSESTLIQCVAL